LGAAVGASALLIAFAAEVMGLAALAVFTAPLLVTQVAFRRYAGIRATYLQTVRALAKVTEIGGYVEAGHSERVSRLAVASGRRPGGLRPFVRAVSRNRAAPGTTTEQPHHQGGQRLRRPGGQLARPGPRRGRGAAAPPGHGQRVRPGHRRGPQPRSKPPLRHP